MREARAAELKAEIINSQKLAGYFKENAGRSANFNLSFFSPTQDWHYTVSVRVSILRRCILELVLTRSDNVV